MKALNSTLRNYSHLLLRTQLHSVLLVEQEKVPLIHLHSHSLGEKSNGWIMPKILAIGVSPKWMLQTQESHISQLPKLKVLSEMLVEQVKAQHSHLLNHSLEEKSSGWTMHKILKTGVFIKSIWPTIDGHIGLH